MGTQPLIPDDIIIDPSEVDPISGGEDIVVDPSEVDQIVDPADVDPVGEAPPADLRSPWSVWDKDFADKLLETVMPTDPKTHRRVGPLAGVARVLEASPLDRTTAAGETPEQKAVNAALEAERIKRRQGIESHLGGLDALSRKIVSAVADIPFSESENVSKGIEDIRQHGLSTERVLNTIPLFGAGIRATKQAWREGAPATAAGAAAATVFGGLASRMGVGKALAFMGEKMGFGTAKRAAEEALGRKLASEELVAATQKLEREAIPQAEKAGVKIAGQKPARLEPKAIQEPMTRPTRPRGPVGKQLEFENPESLIGNQPEPDLFGNAGAPLDRPQEQFLEPLPPDDGAQQLSFMDKDVRTAGPEGQMLPPDAATIAQAPDSMVDKFVSNAIKRNDGQPLAPEAAAAVRERLGKYRQGAEAQPHLDSALNKVESGGLFTQEEIDAMKGALPEAAAAAKETTTSVGVKALQNVWNLDRALRFGSPDMNPMFRQLGFYYAGHPSMMLEAMAKGTRGNINPRDADRIFTQFFDNMAKDPYFKLAHENGLAVELPENFFKKEAGRGGALAPEDYAAYVNPIARKIPIYGRWHEGAAKTNAFIMSGARFDAAKAMMKSVEASGKLDAAAVKELVHTANILTGFGDLPKNGASEVMRTLSTSARYLSARFVGQPRLVIKAFNPMSTMNPVARKEVIRDFSAYMAGRMAFLGTFQLARNSGKTDFSVGLDPLHADFGKGRYKGVTFDPFGGSGQVVRSVLRTFNWLQHKPTRLTGEGEPQHESLKDLALGVAKNNTRPSVASAISLASAKESGTFVDEYGRTKPASAALLEFGEPGASENFREMAENDLPFWGQTLGAALSWYGISGQSYPGMTASPEDVTRNLEADKIRQATAEKKKAQLQMAPPDKPTSEEKLGVAKTSAEKLDIKIAIQKAYREKDEAKAMQLNEQYRWSHLDPRTGRPHPGFDLRALKAGVIED